MVTLRTGLPINPLIGRDIAGVGSSDRQRPQALRSPELPADQRSASQWFDAAAYALPAFGTFSNTARNVLSGPGWQLFDMSFQKVIRFAEGRQFELRADGIQHLQSHAVRRCRNNVHYTGNVW